jgi:hypothetical protein
MQEVVAIKDGFYNGARIKAGTRFQVGDREKSRWFVAAKEYTPPEVKPLVMEVGNAARRKAESFIEAMKKPASGAKRESDSPKTMSEHNKKTPL